MIIEHIKENINNFKNKDNMGKQVEALKEETENS